MLVSVPALPASRDFSVPIQIEAGAPTLHGRIRLPERSSKPKLPLVLVLGGFETGARALDLLPELPDVAWASLDYPFSLEGKWTAEVLLKRGWELRRALRTAEKGLCPFLARIARDRPEIDPANVVVIGASFGAPYALYAAVDCPGIRGLLLIHAFGDVSGALAFRAEKRLVERFGETWGKRAARAVGWIAWKFLGLREPEAVAAKLRSDQAVYWIEAREDDLIAPRSREALREALTASSAQTEFHVTEGQHLRPGAEAQMRELVLLGREWAKRKGFF